MLFFVAFGIKAALFPFYFWLPASYPTPPVAVTALFAGTLTKVGVYSIIRFYSLFVVSDLMLWKVISLTVAGITMVSGVLMAASAFNIRKILSFHIISQIGYMMMGVGLTSVLGLAGAIYFIVHNMLSKTAAFLAGGLISRFRGSDDLAMLGGVYRQRPLLAFLFLIPAFSLAGIPPTPGFFGKLMLIVAGFRAQEWVITTVAIAVGLITLFSMVKIWNEAAWKREPEGSLPVIGHPVPMVSLVSTAVMAAIILAFGFVTGPISSLFTDAASQLLDVEVYIQTVLKMNPL
jgi:multicomponent Na+:H+ antiporter subunit D